LKDDKKGFFKSIIEDNPVFVLCLGLCPTLAVTFNLENAYTMGLSVLFVVLITNIIVSLISKYVDEEIRIPAYIIIIASSVTILELLLGKYLPAISKSLGIYLPLIVVNCIVLGRALSYASSHNVINSIKDAFKAGIGFTLALSLLGLIREVLGSNQITIMDNISPLTGYIMKYTIFFKNELIPNPLFLSPAGAFITLGFLIAFINVLRNRGEAK
jgi:electron transport complex protein RnfE